MKPGISIYRTCCIFAGTSSIWFARHPGGCDLGRQAEYRTCIVRASPHRWQPLGTGQLINNEDVKDNSRKVGAGNSFAASFLTAAWQRPIKRRAPPLSPAQNASSAGTGGVVMPAPGQPAALCLQHALPKAEGAGKWSRGRRHCKRQLDQLTAGLAFPGLAREEHIGTGPMPRCRCCWGSSSGLRSLLTQVFVSRVALHHATIQILGI